MSPRQKLKYYDSPKKLGQRLRAAREAAGVSQRDLGAGNCTAAYISRIEKGERVPSLQLLREFAGRLGVSEDHLAYGRPDGGSAKPSRLVEARTALRVGDLEAAYELADAALSAARSDAERAAATAVFGEIEMAHGRLREAVDVLERARRLSDTIEADEPGAAETLGRAYARLFEYESAIAVFTRNLKRAETDGDVLNVVRFATLLAHACCDSGNFTDAEKALAVAIRVSEETTDPLSRARALWGQSRLHALQNDPATAALYAERALEVLEVSHQDYYAALARQLLAHIELDRGNGERALELLEEAAPLIAGTGGVFERASFEIERARALLELGRGDEAASIAMAASARMQGESSVDAGRAYMLIADVFVTLGDDSRAIELYELALEHLRATPNRYLVEGYSKLAELLEQSGHADRALAVLKEAMNVQQQVDRSLAPRSVP